jgi:putative ABC transport system substrate-binding protein
LWWFGVWRGLIWQASKTPDPPQAERLEQPTRFELIIKLRTAKALGLTIPPSLARRADEVIQ